MKYLADISPNFLLVYFSLDLSILKMNGVENGKIWLDWRLHSQEFIRHQLNQRILIEHYLIEQLEDQVCLAKCLTVKIVMLCTRA